MSVSGGTSGSAPASSGARSGGLAGESSETSGAAAAAAAGPVGSAAAPTTATTATAGAASGSDDDTQVTASVGADGGDGEPPSGRPTKALLAGAGIMGALLLAVPLLFIGGDEDDRSAEQTEPASGVVLPKQLRSGVPTPAYGTASPTASPTPTTSAGGAGATGTDRNKPGSQSGSPATTGTEKSTSVSGTTTTTSQTPRPALTPKVAAQPTVNIANSKNIMLKNASTAMCADLGGSAKGKLGAGVFQEYCYRGTVDNQMWDFEVRYKGAGADGADVFQIRNVKDGLCMDLPGTGAVAMRTHVREGTCTGTTADNQLWWLESRGNGQYWIHNKASNGMCLEVWGADGSGGPDTRLGVYPCSPTDDHEWIVN
ncbi:RICIN domain-containing protein [Streptomyces sp. NPDC020951]|uniref:RICIN domain-containing protein n=1 Tax=Streptomyces sp. NPDC020951 TaxID=3365104 RepID=UPI0037A0DCCD